MPTQVTTFAAALQNAKERQTIMIAATVDLYLDSFTPSVTSVSADFTAAVANYTGYAQKALTPWFDPFLGPGSGYILESPLVVFAVGSVDSLMPCVVGGYVVRDAAGKVRLFVDFDAAVDMSLAGQAVPVSADIPFPAG